MINVWVISIRLGLDQIQLGAIKRPAHAHAHARRAGNVWEGRVFNVGVRERKRNVRGVRGHVGDAASSLNKVPHHII